MLLKEDKIKQEINNLEQDYKKIILEYYNC